MLVQMLTVANDSVPFEPIEEAMRCTSGMQTEFIQNEDIAKRDW